MARVLEKEKHYIEAFEAGATAGNGASAPWLSPFRKAAIQRFAEVGFPNRRDEAWKYFQLTPQIATSFALASPATHPVGTAEIDRLCPNSDGPRLVFVDGLYRAELSRRSELPPGVQIRNLAEACQTEEASLANPFGYWSSLEDRLYAPEHAYAALNTAFFTDGAWIHVPEGTELGIPIELLFYSTVASEGRVTHVRNLITGEPRSQASVIEIHAGADSDPSLHNVLTEVHLKERGCLEHTKIQRENPGAYHVALLRATQEGQSHFETSFFSFGGKAVRHEVEARLLGEGCECGLNGLYVIDGERHVDNTTTLHHAKPHSNSREVYKGVLADRANGAFTGKIFVHEKAQKTDAKQSNDGLLLSTDSVLNTRPNLEIYADDVRCTHGATVGQLNADALFYLQSRGIPRIEARQLLTRAFANEVIEAVTDARLRESLEALLLENLPKGEGST